MSADYEGDSQMHSSPDDSEIDTQTPTAQITNASDLQSPPNSQQRSTTDMPPAASGIAIANSNGKRPIQTISNGNDDLEEIATMANGKARAELPLQTHQQSGYSWRRHDDAPGYGWLNKKAVDEYQRAYDGLVHRDLVVTRTYEWSCVLRSVH